MNTERLDTFMIVYERNLLDCIRDHIGNYSYGPELLPTVMGRMREAIKRGSFNKDGHALKRTCKELGIKHTYQAINEWLMPPQPSLPH